MQVRSWAAGVAGALVVVGLGAQAQAEVRYQITRLGTGIPILNAAMHLNGAGTAIFENGGQVYTWQNGTTTLVPGVYANNGCLAIDDAGHILTEYGGQSALYQGGVPTLLPGGSDAQDLNNNDQVVGYYYNYSALRYRAFTWLNGTRNDLPGNGAGGAYDPGVESRALAVNDGGTIGGSISNTVAWEQPVRWDNGTVVNLGLLAGTVRGQVNSLNAAGKAVGYVADSSINVPQATLWSGTAAQGLGFLPGHTYSMARGINDYDQVVGISQTNSGGSETAFLWQDGQILDLNTLIDPSLNWRLYHAEDIDNSGRIIGWGSINFGPKAVFLLQPIPEPGALALLGLGALAVVARRPRRS